MEVWWKNSNKLDDAFFRELLTLPSFAFHKLVRQNTAHAIEQRERFFATRKAPTFSYDQASAFDVLAYVEAIEQCRNRLPSNPDWIRALYEKKLDELRMRASLILAISRQDDQTVTHLSTKIFGLPRQSVQELEHEFSRMLSEAETIKKHKTPVDAQPFSRMAQAVLDHYGMTDWKVKVKPQSSVNITRGRQARRMVITIPQQLQISRARAARLLTHEIEVHALRTENGRRSPLHILHIGMPGYVRTDEGLAIYYQQRVAKAPSRHAPGFWDAWACTLTQHASFLETFETIARARTQLAQATGSDNPTAIGEDAAWRLCLRAYRGITNTDAFGVGFLRDHLYRSGLLDIQNGLELQGESILENLFVGNLGIDDVSILEKYNFPKPQLPAMVSKSIVKSVLASDGDATDQP